MNASQTIELLKNGTSAIIPLDELQKKLERGIPLKIKLGMDPTAPDLHLGHAVVLSKMRQFQDLGHQAILIIGDFTARIGDPTGKSKTRPPLTDQEIMQNMKTYFDQAGRILDADKLQVRCNSEWLSKLSPQEIIQLLAKVTVARLIERDDFQKRLNANQPIGMHELLYPLMQGYDSVALQSDVELGGTDQTFNNLMGRFLQEQFGQEPQVVITTPLLPGLDGEHKMSKSLGNAIGIAEPADQAFGKLMSLSDTAMWHYFELLLGYPKHEISVLESRVAGGTLHPMELKKQMARDIVAKFWSKEEADKAYKQFEALFQKKDYSQATEVDGSRFQKSIWIVDFLKELGAISSSSDAKRLIESSAIQIDGKAIMDFKAQVSPLSGMTVKVGKHKFYKIK